MAKEWLARILIILGVSLALAIPGYGWWQQSQTLVVHARMAETGGWTPENLTVEVGQPLHLKLTSDDVTHGFAVGKLDQPAVDILPGEITDLTLVFDKPGKYTYYCTRWCSLNHWRMRGTIEVTGPRNNVETAQPPLYVTLGLDIDASHQASTIPGSMPSAWRGALLQKGVPEEYTRGEYSLTHTPLDLWSSLRADPAYTDLSDQQVWDLVAWVWQSELTPAQVQLGRELYQANCAACHGENGAGDGVFAGQLAGGAHQEAGGEGMGGATQAPVDFTDPTHMLSASSAHLQGKIVRGGMGTGMPYWGPIFTDEQTWALVAYLWTFQFDMEVAR
jgi:mono/diheme cytochrome c family protein/plastocyanin